MRFVLNTDRMNQFDNMGTTHNTWPMNLTIYNLSPWLRMKGKYIMLVILIKGPKQERNLMCILHLGWMI
jgi:hypothetical protein